MTRVFIRYDARAEPAASGRVDDDLFEGATFDLADAGREDRPWLLRLLSRSIASWWEGVAERDVYEIEGPIEAPVLRRAGHPGFEVALVARDENVRDTVRGDLTRFVDAIHGLLRVTDGVGAGHPRPRGEVGV